MGGIKKSVPQLPVETGILNSPAFNTSLYLNWKAFVGSTFNAFGLLISQPFGVASPTIHNCEYAGPVGAGITLMVTVLVAAVFSFIVTLAITVALISAAT